MEPLEQHHRARREFDRRVHAVGADQWHAPTPCEDWDVRDLVDHLVTEQLWAAPMLEGATLEEIGDRFDGDQLGDQPVTSWERAAAEARTAFTRPGALEGSVHTTMGPLPTAVYLAQMTLDLAIHAWDLARGIGADERLDDELVEALHRFVEPQRDELAASGVFARPVEVAGSADLQVRLLAMLGRDGR